MKKILEKVYHEMFNVGSVKYVVNFHNGINVNKDGSQLFDVRCFKNKIKKDKFIKELISQGYKK